MSSSQSTRPLRRERRAAALAARRAQTRQPMAARRPGLGLITVASVVAGLVVIGLILALNGTPQAAPTDSLTRAAAPAGIATSGMRLGQAGAPVVIDLYEDFQCPACLAWGKDVFPSLVRNELSAGSVQIAFHSYAFIGPDSERAARAAWAASRQERFWDLWATLYANQGLHENAGAFTRDRLIAMADLIGLDHDRFIADFDSPAAASWVAEGASAAANAGINSTPSLVIAGTVLPSTRYPDVAAAIAAAHP